MKKKWSVWILCFILSFSIFPLTARADTGPKPSVRITFKNMGDEVCYGTLLSETDSTGPASAWDGDPDHIYNYNLDPDISGRHSSTTKIQTDTTSCRRDGCAAKAKN